LLAPSSPVGLHRVIEPAGAALPQAAQRLDDRPELWPDEVRIRVETLNLDAASYRQLAEAHPRPGGGGDAARYEAHHAAHGDVAGDVGGDVDGDVDGGVDGDAVREAVLAIVAERGKMQNPVTGSGGMLIGTVDEVGPESPLGLRPGDHVATLVSLSLTPLRITDGLERWDGRSERVPADRPAKLFCVSK
jgi:L-erythro-3,5-diaminohexanoate dehydrogenase